MKVMSPSLNREATLFATTSEKEVARPISEEFEAFDQLFKSNYEGLCHFVTQIVSCHHTAEEIVADVFWKLWKNRADLKINRSLKAYLKTAVRNQSIDYLRKKNRMRKMESKMDAQSYINKDCPESILIVQELRDHIEHSVELLPPQGQNVYRLSRDKGLKYKEIAEFLDISLKTVETHMRRSLISIRREMAGYVQENPLVQG